jgi:hypothetical protein
MGARAIQSRSIKMLQKFSSIRAQAKSHFDQEWHRVTARAGCRDNTLANDNVVYLRNGLSRCTR